MKRVVITGVGVISSLGNNADTFWQNIKDGKCGIDFIQSFDTENYKVKVASEVKDFKPQDYMEKKAAKRMDKFSQYAVAATKLAYEDSKLDDVDVDRDRMGVIFGSGIGGLSTIEKQQTMIMQKGPDRISPFFIPMSICNMAAGHVAIMLGAKNICNTVVTACASGTNAIGEAFRQVKYGLADIMVTGGSEASVTPLAVAGFTSMKALSTSKDPKKASIPFDNERDGFVIGEGAGVLVIEELEHAKKRNAHIYAEIVGYGATCDAYHITAPAPGGEGAAKAMKLAIDEAGISPEDVSYINAHGTSTPYNDKFETEAIKTVFSGRENQIPVSSTKSMTGHLLGAAGGVEAIVCAKALEDKFIPPTIGLENKDPECDLDYVPNTGRKADLKYAMSNSLGFGGHNAVLLLKKWED
ncbi:beta-ketoacyl-ACP synthase II [Abyssisolibacter fermentans]|uniref:beta-ketoacyl-ACP synthase II n=1 Tax=Abyssisolibacter fermentans TaxID=1766203 RepID=UPI00082B57AC|nr:beta-ketoacyl-ACP synthase II [Abyssisolibacter fermentans]